jgi:hypothetical protein
VVKINRLTIKDFFLSALKRTVQTFLDLMKIIIPVYTIVYILSITPFLKMFGDFLKPAMKFLGLPGESALALILGNFINIYAAIGVIPQLHLNPHQITTLSLMLLTSHSQLLESSVFLKLKTKFIFLLLLRILVAVIIGYLMAQIPHLCI